MAKPTKIPVWATTLAADVTTGINNRIEPSAGKKVTGFTYNEKPPRQDINWLLWVIGEWMTYLDTVIDQDVTSGASPTFGALAVSTLAATSQVETDVIIENSTDSGVTIEGTLHKDGDITNAIGDLDMNNITSEADMTCKGTVKTNYIEEQGGPGFIEAKSNIDMKLLTLLTDTITESTNNNGVVIENVTLKDSTITATGNITTASSLLVAGVVNTNTITEYTTGSGVVIENVTLKDSAITAPGNITTSGSLQVDGVVNTNTITENTTNNGVTIEGVKCIDDDVEVTEVRSSLITSTTVDTDSLQAKRTSNPDFYVATLQNIDGTDYAVCEAGTYNNFRVGAAEDGRELAIRNGSEGQIITIINTSSTGFVSLYRQSGAPAPSGCQPMALSVAIVTLSLYDTITLIFTNNNWLEISFSDNSI